MRDLNSRIIRAAKLDPNLYEEVEADQDATGQALGVVILSSVAGGIGTISSGGVPGIVLGTFVTLAGWCVWSYLTYLIGAKLLPEPQTEANLGQLLRTTGFASSPGLVRVLGIIPGLVGVLFLAVSIWMLVAMVIAVRQALDYTGTARAVVVCAIGWVVQAAILLLLLHLLGVPGVGIDG